MSKIKLLCALAVIGILVLPTSCLPLSELRENLARLTKNLFDNLEEDPLCKSKNLTKPTQKFVEKHVANYVQLMKKTYIPGHSVSRRSLPLKDTTMLTKDNIGVYILDGFIPRFKIQARFPIDIVLFEQEFNGTSVLYAAVLECPLGQNSDMMIIYKLVGSEFSEVNRVEIDGGVKLGVHVMSNSTFIVVAEKFVDLKFPIDPTALYMFSTDEVIKRIQSLDKYHAHDVVVWEANERIFMVILYHAVPRGHTMKYAVISQIYQWKGNHFDSISKIITYGAQRAIPFVIGNSHFLAVANSQNNDNKTRIFSEIFRTDLHGSDFKSYQKILTNAAMDVKYFCFKQNNVQENFLVFANMYEEDLGVKNYSAGSVIYKYIDNYFIPFQNIELTAPTEWLPVSGPNGEFILLVACKFEGIKAFQYDGWKFVQSPIEYTNEAFGKGVVSMRSYQFHDQTFVVVSNENDPGRMMKVFQPIFNHRNMLTEFHDDMLKWCNQSLQNVTTLDLDTITKKVEDAPKHDDPILQLAQSATFNNLTVENLRTIEPKKSRSKTNEDQLSQLKNEVNDLSKELRQIDEQMRMSLHTTGINFFQGDVEVKELILNSPEYSFNSLTAKSINDKDISSLLDDVININNGFEVKNPMAFDSITVNRESLPTIVNDSPDIDLRIIQKTPPHAYDLVVNGDVTFKSGLFVDGKLNNIDFTKENILLNKGDQKFSNLHVRSLTAEKLDAKFVNNLDMSRATGEGILDNIENLTAKTVFIDGLINEVNIASLNEYTLKTSGDQKLTDEYIFDSLHVDNINVQSISGKKVPDDLVLINSGYYKIDYDILFSSDFNASKLLVSGRLNNIEVINGKLDVVLSNVPHIQHLTGNKEFENVELLSPIKLQGKINNDKLDQLKPIAIIDEEVVLTGDYTIAGDVKIEELLQADDLQSLKPTDNSDRVHSVKRLQESGIKITQDRIDAHLHFTQELHVKEVFTDTINDIDVNTLVTTGSNTSQIITGWKKFLGDVQILGPTRLDIVNGINVQDFESGLLRVHGDQTMSGKYHFENIIANRVYNIKTQFGEKLWTDVVTTYGDQNIAGTTLISNSIHVDQLEANVINCKQINGYDFTAMINDTAYRDQKMMISGRKQFLDLTVENLHLPNVDLNALPRIIETANGTFQYDEDIELPDIEIQSIFFNNNFNDIPADVFGRQWLKTSGQEGLLNDQSFTNITVYGKLYVESGLINGISINGMKENSVKIDEPFDFHTATFLHGLESKTAVMLEGEFESLYLKDIVQSYTQAEQILTGQITFFGEVTVSGKLHFDGLVSGVNLSQICDFGTYRQYGRPKNLHINGNAYFRKGPEVFYINDRPIREIMDNVWFTDKEALITGHMVFDQALFQEDVTVNGFVDDVKLELVAKTYFSKTRDQNISAFLSFDEGVAFSGGIRAKEATVGGNIGDININEFVRTALLQDYSQVFENTIYLEDCEIMELHGDYLVNQLNLQEDVMRYDQDNVVTGNKVIRDVTTSLLNTGNRDISVQNVGILYWLSHCVSKSGTYRITGTTMFVNHTTFSNGINCEGLINGVKFQKDSLMFKSKTQAITGRKTFSPGLLKTLHFKSIELYDLLNDINMTRLMSSQVYKSRHNVFTTPVVFTSTLTTPNVNIKQLYYGINVTQLIYNITHFSTIDNYYDSYALLLNTSRVILDSLKAQAYFLDYYQVRQIYQMIDIIVPVKFDGVNVHHLACIMMGHNNYTIQFDAWDQNAEYFHQDSEVSIILWEKQLHYMKGITYRGTEHWYIEHQENYEMHNEPPQPFTHEGSIYKITRYGLKQMLPSIRHNGTQSVTSVTIPDANKECLLVLFDDSASLYCEDVGKDGQIYLNYYQLIATYGSTEALSSIIQDVPYIFVVNKATSTEQPSVDIWKLNTVTKIFDLDQIIYTASPNSITTAFYRGTHYLAIASGHVQNTKHAGVLEIRTFDLTTQKFTTWQDLKMNAPIQVEFAELPTKELVLYVVTDNPSEPVVIYEYAGVSGFKAKIVASTIPKTMSMRSFTTSDNKHFILAQNMNEIRVMQAKFKGDKY